MGTESHFWPSLTPIVAAIQELSQTIKVLTVENQKQGASIVESIDDFKHASVKAHDDASSQMAQAITNLEQRVSGILSSGVTELAAITLALKNASTNTGSVSAADTAAYVTRLEALTLAMQQEQSSMDAETAKLAPSTIPVTASPVTNTGPTAPNGGTQAGPPTSPLGAPHTPDPFPPQPLI